jgi:hypothetical protein
MIVVGCAAGYENPPATLEEADLIGTWETKYGGGAVDQLVLRADGKFKQTYQASGQNGYTYETDWNDWWLEHLPDGRAHVHLQGARFYPDGIEVAERDGLITLPDFLQPETPVPLLIISSRAAWTG